MPAIIFQLNIEKDLENIWKTANETNPWYDFKESISNNLYNASHNKNFEDIKEELFKINSNIYNSELIKEELVFINQIWEKISQEYFKRLENITGKKFPYETIKAYITTIGRCPYSDNPNDPYFFVSIFAGIPKIMATAGHELLHIHFHAYYWKVLEEKLGKEKTADLKEALTELLNLEFKDLWLQYDKGYEPHKQLRKFIKQEWQKEKDFDKLLEKCVDHLL